MRGTEGRRGGEKERVSEGERSERVNEGEKPWPPTQTNNTMGEQRDDIDSRPIMCQKRPGMCQKRSGMCQTFAVCKR